MIKLICHPDNWEFLKTKINRGDFDSLGAYFDVQTNKYMDKTKPTGKYIVDGKAVDKSEIRIKHRFIEYGPEDIEWLLYAGIIREEQEMLFYEVNDSMFRMSMDYAPLFSNPRIFFNGSF